MIGYFTEYWENECLYSRVARFREYTGFSVSTVANMLFGTKYCGNLVFFPSNLKVFVDRLKPDWVESLTQVLRSYTMLPVYSPFISKEEITNLKQQMMVGQPTIMSFTIQIKKIGLLFLIRSLLLQERWEKLLQLLILYSMIRNVWLESFKT